MTDRWKACPLCGWSAFGGWYDTAWRQWFLCSNHKCNVHQVRDDGAVRLFGYPNIVVRIIELKAGE